MKVILREHVKKVGRRWDSVEVAPGYALNYLIPQGLAQVADPALEERLEALRAAEKELQQKEVNALMEMLEQASPIELTKSVKVNEQGYLFAGIKRDEIIRELEEKFKTEIDPEYLVLPSAIKEVGAHELTLSIGEKEFPVTYTVAAEE